MKKLLIAAALSAAVIAPVAASAADPGPSDFKNAAKYCKALKAASGSNFSSMFGTKKNAYGKCVSQTAKQHANKDAKQEKTAKTNAAKECKTELGDSKKGGKNAYGKCVSSKAKAKTKQDTTDRVNAAKTCKADKKADKDAFATKWGSGKNAFGKCVSATAKAKNDDTETTS